MGRSPLPDPSDLSALIEGMTKAQKAMIRAMALKANPSADAVLAQQCARFEELWFELLEADIPDARASFNGAVADAVRAAYEHAAKIAENHKRDASFDDSMAGALEHNSNQANIAAEIRAAIPS